MTPRRFRSSNLASSSAGFAPSPLVAAASPLHVLTKGCVLSLCRSQRTLVHFSAPEDQVQEDSEIRQDKDAQGPSCLAPPGEVAAPEEIAEHHDQQPDPDDPEEENEKRPEDLAVTKGRQHRSPFSRGRRASLRGDDYHCHKSAIDF